MWRNAACHPGKCDIINDVKRFPAVYRRIYGCKFWKLSNQKSHYKSKCIRMYNITFVLVLIISSLVSKGQNICFHVVVHFIPFNLICNMTIF